jgi:predicted MPP superfamily phosphohydrolase
LGVGAGLIYLMGLDDAYFSTPNPGALIYGCPAGALPILALHEPDPADDIAALGRVALQLSGHTHGGQVRLPGLGAPVLPPMGLKYDQGLFRVGDMWLYTTRGIGVPGPPVRFNCPPEITEITLLSGA